jgi:hypothetical protein
MKKNLVSFGRALRPCAVRAFLLRRIDIKYRALRDKLNLMLIWWDLALDFPLYVLLHGDCYCSARDWDGKDYLRIIPRVVW